MAEGPQKEPIYDNIDPESAQMTQFVPLERYLGEDPQLGFANYRASIAGNIINILVVGRSQSGKSTLVQTLLNPRQAVQGRGYAATKDPQCYSMAFHDKEEDKYYTMKIIDTPGLEERGLNRESRGDEEILSLAGDALRKTSPI